MSDTKNSKCKKSAIISNSTHSPKRWMKKNKETYLDQTWKMYLDPEDFCGGNEKNASILLDLF